MDFFDQIGSIDSQPEPPKEEVKKVEEKKIILEETKPNANVFSPPSNLHPINFVDFIENNYPDFFSSNSSSIFKLSAHRDKNVKFKLLEESSLKELNDLIINDRNGREITAMKVVSNKLFLSDDLGRVHVYDTDKERKIKTLSLGKSGPSQPVKASSIDCIDNGKYLCVGYGNGYVAIWDISSEKDKPMYLNKEAHKVEVIAVKFIRREKDDAFYVLTSDRDLQVLELIFYKKFFVERLKSECIYKEDSPTYLIEICEVSPGSCIAAFATTSKVKLYQIEPNKKLIYDFPLESDGTSIRCVPDVSFGFGCEPEKGAFYRSQGDDDDEKKLTLLIAISWQKVIRLYSLLISDKYNNEIIIGNGGTPVGHFVNLYPIIRLGFISASILYFFDSQKKIQIFNTSIIKSGDYTKNAASEEMSKNSLIEDGTVIDPDIMDDDVSFKGLRQFSYRNFIVGSNKSISLLCKKKFHMSRLLNYEECINELKENDKWIDALLLGIDIFKGDLTSFPDIPINSDERKKEITPFLQNLISDYITMNTKKERSDFGMLGTMNSSDKRKFTESLNNCMDITIEFCLSCKCVDFLFTDIQMMFEGYGDEFNQRIEPFIFANKLKNESVAPPTISSLLMTYGSKNQYSLLSHLLPHLNFDSINHIFVESSCDKYNLFTTMIYLKSNCPNSEDNFKPIFSMFDLFIKKRNKNELDPEDTYVEIYKKQGIDFMEKTTSYIMHKLFWYIDLCLNGKKLKYTINDNESFDINSKNYHSLVAMIYVWLTSDKNFDILLKFDSYSFFFVLGKLFTVSYLIKIIEGFDYKALPEKFKQNVSISKEIDYKNISCAIEYIVKKAQSETTFFIEQDLNMFIIQIAGQNDTKIIKKDLLLSACNGVFNYYSAIHRKTPEELKDRFKCHGVEGVIGQSALDIRTSNDNVKAYVNEISKTLINLLKSSYELTSEDHKALLKMSESSLFVQVKIKLLELIKDYSQCLDNYLENLELLERKSIFNWLESKLEELSEKRKKFDSPDFVKFEQAILDKILPLFEISINEMTVLVNDWFDIDKRIEICKKLESIPATQIVFVEKLIDEIEKLSECHRASSIIVNAVTVPEETEVEMNKKLTELLMIHFELLIKLKRNKDIVKYLEKRTNLYPIQECIEKSKQNKLIEALVFLYLKLGEHQEALNAVNEEIQSIFVDFTTADVPNQEQISKFKGYFENCIFICKEASEQYEDTSASRNNTLNNLWLILLKDTYSFYNKSILLKKEPIVKLMSELIEKLLKEMCCYVNIKLIIDSVTKEYQEAEFKEFKNLLIKVLRSNDRLTNILRSARTLLSNSVLYNVVDFKRAYSKGNVYKKLVCNVCHRKLADKNKEYFFAFRCGHLAHEKCTKIVQDEPECIVCQKNEIESNVDTEGEISFFGSQQKFPMKKENDIETERRIRQNNLRKLREKDNDYVDKSQKL